MQLNELKPIEGSRKKHYRKGRGLGSGNGKNAGSGNKGQKSRSGGNVALGFEGGQLPLWRRLPKRGFKNINHVTYAIVNVNQLNQFKEGSEITPALLIEEGLVHKEYDGIKILGQGELTVKLTVKAHKFSKSAQEAIEKVGGKVEVI